MRVENVCGPAPAGGTRRHHEAAAQLSGTEAQHPPQPVPAGVRTKVKCGSFLLDDFVLDFHHGKIEFNLGLGRFGGEIAADNLCEQLTCLL